MYNSLENNLEEIQEKSCKKCNIYRKLGIGSLILSTGLSAALMASNINNFEIFSSNYDIGEKYANASQKYQDYVSNKGVSLPVVKLNLDSKLLLPFLPIAFGVFGLFYANKKINDTKKEYLDSYIKNFEK